MRSLQSLTVSPDTTVNEALDRLDKSEVRIVAIVDGSGRLVGSLTDGDVRRGLLRNVPLSAAVSEVMNASPVTKPGGIGWPEALDTMSRHRVWQLLLVDDDGRLQGIVTSRGQAVGIELGIRPQRAVEGDHNVPVVILAGGLGTRLHPLTESAPKPLLPVGDRPLLETIVQGLARQGFRRIYMSVNYKADMIVNHFGDGTGFDVNIHYLHEDKRLGTAGSLSLLPDGLQAPVIVLNGDVLTAVDYRHLLDFHLESHCAATMCVRPYNTHIPYGIVEIERDQVIALKEKPQYTYFINAGIYVLDAGTLSEVPYGEFFDMPQLINKIIDSNKTVRAFPIREYWLDIGRKEDYEQAQSDIRNIE